jgi:pilus assembly protein CpaC
MLSAAGPAAAAVPVRMDIQSASSNNNLHIIVGQSVILHDVGILRRIYVGNPTILQTFTSSPQEVVVTAKTAGLTSLVIWDAADRSTMYNVHADVDAVGLEQSLQEAYPSDKIEVQGVEDRITLSGIVHSSEVADGITKIAALYGKDVVSSLRIVQLHGKQVQLKLRIAEVDRTKLEQFGVNFFRPQGNNVGSVTTGQFSSSMVSEGAAAASPLNLFFFNFGHNAGVTIQDLESANVLQILAEPTLTTMSGKEANFLSGGEFPVPVVQGGTGNSTAITIQFRPYGVKVDFTPTVNDDGTIHLKIAPEVSTLDYGNAVTISGFTVPALETRRAETEVEIRDGQSFVLSGLLNHSTTDSLSRIPGIGSIPILGQLFRSKNVNHSTTELVIMVTATVVDPLTETEKITEPKFVVPNLDQKKFDKEVDKGEKTGISK